MKKAIIGAFAVAPLAVGGAIYFAQGDNLRQSDYALTSGTGEALVMIPAFSQQWLDVTNTLYLETNGFEGTPVWLEVPQTYNLNASISGATDILVNAVEQRWADNDFDASDPLYIFGYSQASVVAGLAEQQIHADYPDIPKDALHFVLVGDSAAANTGFLSQFIPWLNSFFPESWRQPIDDFLMQLLKQFNADSVFGEITPNDLYSTDVYTLTGDGWANWGDGANASGMFSQHLAYLGLTPDEIASATTVEDGLTDYHVIDSADVDFFSAYTNALDVAVAPFI
jgi:hypothetical protein